MQEPAAAFFIIAKHCNQLRCTSTGEWLNKLAHLNYGILVSNKKGWTIVPHNHLNESLGAHAEWNKSIPQKLHAAMIPLT